MMTKRKRIQQLEAQIADKNQKIHRLEAQLADKNQKIELIQNTLDSTPEDCKLGGYCKACSFSKAYRVFNRRVDDFDVIYLCNKAGSCENFVQKEKQ